MKAFLTHYCKCLFVATQKCLVISMQVVILTQFVHFGEHTVQIWQLTHGVPGPQAKAVLGQIFDAEYFHFAFNTYLLTAMVYFLLRSPRNPFLWIGLVIGAAHEAEHIYLVGQYMALGKQGLPGIIGAGGAAHILTQFTRPYIHFAYNFIETLPLLMAYLFERGWLRIPRIAFRRATLVTT